MTGGRIAALANQEPSAFWSHYWQYGALAVLVYFGVGEGYTLATNWQNTLSANIWRMEDFMPGQSVINWSAVHFLFIGVLFVIDIWLLGHFGWGLWRR